MPGRVGRWIKTNGDPRAGDLDEIDWIERIPFDETRSYVQRILEAATVYEHRLREQKAALERAEGAAQ